MSQPDTISTGTGTTIDSVALQEALAAAGAAEREQILRETIRAQAAYVLSRAAIEDDSNFLEEGITSLKALELNRNLMALTDVEIPLVAIIEHPTPAKLAQYLAAALTEAKDG